MSAVKSVEAFAKRIPGGKSDDWTAVINENYSISHDSGFYFLIQSDQKTMNNIFSSVNLAHVEHEVSKIVGARVIVINALTNRRR